MATIKDNMNVTMSSINEPFMKYGDDELHKVIIPMDLGPNYEHNGRYSIGLDGILYSNANGYLKPIKGANDGNGYLKVKLYLADGRMFGTRIHRIIAETVTRTYFPHLLEEYDLDGWTVDHIKSEEKTNNSIKNLRWLNGYLNSFRKKRNYYMWEKEVLELVYRKYFIQGESMRTIALEMKKGYEQISKALRLKDALKWCKDRGITYAIKQQNATLYEKDVEFFDPDKVWEKQITKKKSITDNKKIDYEKRLKDNIPKETREKIFDMSFRQGYGILNISKEVHVSQHYISYLLKSEMAHKWCKRNKVNYNFRSEYNKYKNL